MKKILSIAILVLAACGSSDKPRTIQWGAPQAPNAGEQSAVSSAALTLQGSLDYQASTEPTAGAAGLGDQLAASLASAAASAPGAPSAKLAEGVVRQAIATGGLDPSCVVPTVLNGVTKYTWTGCVVDDSSTDPYTGDTTTLHVTVDGWLTWNPLARETVWSIGMTMTTTQTSGPDTVTMGATLGLGGNQRVTDTRIVADTTSTAHLTERMQGPSGNLYIEGDVRTTLDAALDYVASPSFCITGGGLTVVQDTTIYGQTQTDAWDLTWTGCGLFEIRHGH